MCWVGSFDRLVIIVLADNFGRRRFSLAGEESFETCAADRSEHLGSPRRMVELRELL
jgi:hypothetical protein